MKTFEVRLEDGSGVAVCADYFYIQNQSILVFAQRTEDDSSNKRRLIRAYRNWIWVKERDDIL